MVLKFLKEFPKFVATATKYIENRILIYICYFSSIFLYSFDFIPRLEITFIWIVF